MKEKKPKTIALSPIQVRRQQRSLLRKMQGMWRNRQPDPIKELERMRNEWDRN